jgi:hypothetical protein
MASPFTTSHSLLPSLLSPLAVSASRPLVFFHLLFNAQSYPRSPKLSHATSSFRSPTIKSVFCLLVRKPREDLSGGYVQGLRDVNERLETSMNSRDSRKKSLNVTSEGYYQLSLQDEVLYPLHTVRHHFTSNGRHR